MTIESAVYHYLSNHSEVSGFFNSIEFVELPESPPYPALVIRKISNPEDHQIPFGHPRFQLDIYAQGDDAAAYGQVKQGEGIVKNAIKGFKGYFDTVPIKFITLLNSRDMPTQEKLRRVQQDYQIHYKL